MKHFKLIAMLGTLALIPRPVIAQSKTQDKPGVPVKVQIIFSEYDGEKKISSIPYSFIAITDEKVGGNYTTILRTGVRVPVEADGKDQKSTYIDIGTNIDCGVKASDNNRYHVYLVLERSSLYPPANAADEKVAAPHPGPQPPMLRQFRVSENVIVEDRQSAEILTSADPISGHSLRISVAVNALK